MRHYPNPKGKPITGILLYPRKDRDLNVSAVSTLNRQDRIRFQTLDLSRPWPEIRQLEVFAKSDFHNFPICSIILNNPK
jgi:hypothetical protein